MVETVLARGLHPITVVAVAVAHRLFVQMEQQPLAGMAALVRHQASAVHLSPMQAAAAGQPKVAGQAAQGAQVVAATALRQTQLAALEQATQAAVVGAAVKLAEALQQQAAQAARVS